MYKPSLYRNTQISINNAYQGETIEKKIQRIVNNKEPITDNAPIIYTERKDGVNPSHNIRTDRFEVAIEAMDKVSKSMRAKREGKPKTGDQETGKAAVEGMKKEGDGGAKSIDTTGEK